MFMSAAPPPRSRLLVKVLVALAVVAGLALTFWRTVHSARGQAYVVPQAHLRPWTLSVEMGSQPNDPILMLRPPSALTTDLFDQVFKRSMESMRAPETAGIPLVLTGELERAGAGISADELLNIARQAGLESTPPVPRCIAHRRAAEPDARQQIYFAMFESASFDRFRRTLAERLGPSFNIDLVSPVLFVGVIESPLHKWLPLRPDAKKDCVAPIEVSVAQ
jgi:hypothetical protein